MTDQEMTPREGRPLKVLAADDHPTNRTVVETILDMISAEVTSVEDGQQALSAFQAEQFDVVLMDLQMPVMDGLSATREIRRHEESVGARRTPLIVVTANGLGQVRVEAMAAGADGFLPKPVMPQALIGAITAALEGSPAR